MRFRGGIGGHREAAVLDLSLLGPSGMEIVEHIKAGAPATEIIVVIEDEAPPPPRARLSPRFKFC